MTFPARENLPQAIFLPRKMLWEEVFFKPFCSFQSGAFNPMRVRHEKKSTKINFLDLETARWGGGLPREGVVAEKFVPSLESLSSLGFEERNLGCPENFAGISRTPGGVQKVWAKKVRANFSFPNESHPLQS